MSNQATIRQTIEAIHANNDKAALIACLMNQSADANPSPTVLKKAADKIQEATSMIRELLEALEVEAAQ